MGEAGRVKRKSYSEIGHLHELTFSTYRRQKFFVLPSRLQLFLDHVFKASQSLEFDVVAFAVMPEHCHLLIYPRLEPHSMPAILKAIKAPFAKEILGKEPLLKADCRIKRNGRLDEFRFWQAGGGYDRNLWSEAAIRAVIDYIHMNPVRRGLCDKPEDWKWSSYRNYLQEDSAWPVTLYT